MLEKTKFVRFLLETGTLTFGDFALKNGRRTPYSIDTDKLDSGMALSRMGSCFARVIYEKMEMDVVPWETTTLYGLPSKGVTLATAASVALAAAFDLDFGCTFNRKGTEASDPENIFVGKKPKEGDLILIIDDYITSGTTLRETVGLLKEFAPGANVIGSVIAVDLKECGRDSRLSAVAEAEYELGLPIFSLIDIDEILVILKNDVIDRRQRDGHMPGLPTKEQIDALENHLSESRTL